MAITEASYAKQLSESKVVNIANRLTQVAERVPTQVATVETVGREGDNFRYRTRTFAEIEDESNRIAAGLSRMGVVPGERLVLMVPFSHEFLALTFALFKAGVVTVLIDPGMGRRNMIRCLAEIKPDGFIAIPLAHAVRAMLSRRFPRARHLVTVGRRWFWGGKTLAALQKTPLNGFAPIRTRGADPAAIIFTTGSTGPPKGVLYRHGNFDRQVSEIATRYEIQPGGIDLACFPLFGLFNGGMGTTTVIPNMDPTRPAKADPRSLIRMMEDWKVTQAFASPAVWNNVGRYCERQHVKLPKSIRQIFSAGAPVPTHVMQRLHAAAQAELKFHTPYGATEALPVASISSREVLDETAEASTKGAGICVGTRFPGIEWKVVEITDGPLSCMHQVTELPTGEIGELMVRGAVVTAQYVTGADANALHKVTDGETCWHRMGDVGYLDDRDRFWFCGRKSHRVSTLEGTMFTIPCEAIFNQHPAIYRSALVGVGERGAQIPVIVCEPWPEAWLGARKHKQTVISELAELAATSDLTSEIGVGQVLLRKSLPVDIRHNSKIFREKLRDWCASRVKV